MAETVARFVVEVRTKEHLLSPERQIGAVRQAIITRANEWNLDVAVTAPQYGNIPVYASDTSQHLKAVVVSGPPKLRAYWENTEETNGILH
jgi:hypothetical protein